MRQWLADVRTACLTLFLLILVPSAAFAASAPLVGSNPCPRPAQGSIVQPAPDLYSKNGVLNVKLGYYTTVDQWGRTLFCYMTPDGGEAPTLHVNPGDTLNIQFTNIELTIQHSGGQDASKDVLSLQSLGSGAETAFSSKDACLGTTMLPESANMHFHGFNVTPKCHSDEVIFTIVNPGQTFDYHLKIPNDEPPGMYWYHAHVHGIASPAVQGGASGAIEVEGIANYQPAVQGLPQRFLTVRDQPLQNPDLNWTGRPAPFWDVSLNYVPVSYPQYVPGIIQMQAGAQEFWRVVNAAADTIMDLQLIYDGVPQPLQVVGLDGVPVGSQDGKHQGYIITKTDVYIPPAGRAEFIVTGPSASVKNAVFMTRQIDTGPGGDVDTQRPLAQIQLTTDPKKIPKPVPAASESAHRQRFEGVTDGMVTANRTLYFDERFGAGKKGPSGGLEFFITVDGEYDRLYAPYNPPAIITHRGAVEDWTIENHTNEVHEFHIHQIHFQLIAINGKPVPPKQRQWYDTYQVGYWKGKGKFPSITVRMDFRGAVEGEFVYHCHILDHEDGGMMANILVLPPVWPPPHHARAGRVTHQASLGSRKRKGATAHA